MSDYLLEPMFLFSEGLHVLQKVDSIFLLQKTSLELVEGFKLPRDRVRFRRWRNVRLVLGVVSRPRSVTVLLGILLDKVDSHFGRELDPCGGLHV